jgi:hypothetical protein
MNKWKKRLDQYYSFLEEFAEKKEGKLRFERSTGIQKSIQRYETKNRKSNFAEGVLARALRSFVFRLSALVSQMK